MASMVFSLLIFFGLIFSSQAHAFNLGLDTSYGTFSFIESVYADGDFGDDDSRLKYREQESWVWTLAYLFNESRSYDSSANLSVDQSSQVVMTTGQKKFLDYEYGGGIQYSQTPQESIKAFGPQAYIGETFALEPRKAGFYRTLGVKLTLADTGYIQTFTSLSPPGKGQQSTVTGSSAINQTYALLETTWSLFSLFTFRLNYAHYHYDTNAADFLTNLDSATSIAIGASGLSGAVSGFPVDSLEFDMSYYPSRRWECDFQGSYFRAQVDNGATYTAREGVNFTVQQNFRVGIFTEFESSEYLTDHLYTASLRYSQY